MENISKFYKILDREIKKQGHTNQKVAHELGVSGSMIQKYRSGESSPNLEKIIKLALFLKVSIDYLLTGKDHGSLKSKKKKISIEGQVVGRITGIIEIE